MKIFLVTDVEGVSGVLNFRDWCVPEGRYYEKAKRLLTEEVNAVIDGMFAGGASEILVCDGHGHGAIDPELLDERADLQRGIASPVWPFTLDESFDGIGWVGQHAQAGTPYSHMTHTGTFHIKEMTVNGIAVGEFGEFALAAAELGVPVIFAGGEEAFAREAEAFAPGVIAVGTKRGCNTEDGLEDATAEAYENSKLAAIHISPARARKKLREGAEKAVRKLRENPQDFHTREIKPPYVIKSVFRKSEQYPDHPQVLYQRHETSYIAALNSTHEKE